MQNTSRAKLALMAVVVLATGAAPASTKEFRFRVSPGATLTIVNRSGPIRVRAAQAGLVVVSANPSSSDIQIDCRQTGNHVDVTSRFVQKPGESDSRVGYELQVPADASVTIRTATGPVQVQGVIGEIAIDADTGDVEVRNSSGHVRVRTIGGPITLADLKGGVVEARSVSGQVTLKHVDGKTVTVHTTGGPISYTGDAASGEYSFSSHSGAIDVSLPRNAAADVSARSVTGTVENDFPTTAASQPGMTFAQAKPAPAKSSPTASSLQLQTFSGKIRVKKQ